MIWFSSSGTFYPEIQPPSPPGEYRGFGDPHPVRSASGLSGADPQSPHAPPPAGGWKPDVDLTFAMGRGGRLGFGPAV